MDPPSQSRLLTLPLELREHIYEQLFLPSANRYTDSFDFTSYAYQLSFFRVCWQVYHESRAVFRKLNTFVRIETPWHEAQQYIEMEGHVPLIIKGDMATGFKDHTLSVLIEAPRYQRPDILSHMCVIHVDDLDRFCRMWFYSDLSHDESLNQHLRLTLLLRNPATAAALADFASHTTGSGGGSGNGNSNGSGSPNGNPGNQNRNIIPRALQKRLLEPFEKIKGLQDCRFEGAYDSRISQAVAKVQREPYVTREQCIENGNKLKDEGDVAMRKGNYHEAITLYLKAFEAIHITNRGHHRSVWADAFFEYELIAGPDKGQYAQIIRLILRVRLVASVVQAYLKLENWEEAQFWGIRTIRLTREAYGLDPDEQSEDEPLITFNAMPEMGHIYYRTAIAYRKLDDELTAWKLIRIAKKYLPEDPNVQQEQERKVAAKEGEDPSRKRP